MSRPASLLLALVAIFLMFGSPAAAQNQSTRGRLIVTVNDSTAGVLPTATVTVVGLEAATRTAPLTPLQTTNAGIAIFDNLAPGRYTAVAEFTGFVKATPKEVRVRAGDNRLTIVLSWRSSRTRSPWDAINRRPTPIAPRRSADLPLTPAQIAELSDDPATMRQQLEDLAGPGVTIAVDSFEGAANCRTSHRSGRSGFHATSSRPGNRTVPAASASTS